MKPGADMVFGDLQAHKGAEGEEGHEEQGEGEGTPPHQEGDGDLHEEGDEEGAAADNTPGSGSTYMLSDTI